MRYGEGVGAGEPNPTALLSSLVYLMSGKVDITGHLKPTTKDQIIHDYPWLNNYRIVAKLD